MHISSVFRLIFLAVKLPYLIPIIDPPPQAALRNSPEIRGPHTRLGRIESDSISEFDRKPNGRRDWQLS